MSTQPDGPTPEHEDTRDSDDLEQADETPAFDIDLEPEDQGTAEAAPEPSG